jgi:sortase A
VPLKTGIAAMTIALAFAGAVFGYASWGGPEEIGAVKSATKEPNSALSRSDPGVNPWKEANVAFRGAEEKVPEPEPKPGPEPKPEPKPKPESKPPPATAVETSHDAAEQPAPKPDTEPAPIPDPEPTPNPAPVATPSPETDAPKPYSPPDGAIMALTVDALGLREVPVFDSTGAWALKYGVGHDPDTSLPWTDSPHRNVYVAGHKVGFPGTASDRVFDRLGDLGEGDEVVLRGDGGARYRYEVTESFIASPEDSWVADRVRNEDLLTLQTCVGPNFSERLIVRAERV